MKFSDAKARLKKIAGGRYHMLTYGMIENGDGVVTTQCSIYIDGETFYNGRTFEDAFYSREHGGATVVEEMPDHEV
jgi:hypothetical protein